MAAGNTLGSAANLTLLPAASLSMTTNVTAPEWMVNFVEFRKRLFMQTVEPIIVALLGPVVPGENEQELRMSTVSNSFEHSNAAPHLDGDHRRLSFDFMPNYADNPYSYRETSMSFATLMMLFVLMSCILAVFLSCFYHNQKTSPLFISPRRHRLPKLVPPPLPIDGYFDWVSKCTTGYC